MSCTDTCPDLRERRSYAHCSVCHRTFTGVRNFDMHRRVGTCVDPASRNMTDKNGAWGFHGTFAADRQPWS